MTLTTSEHKLSSHQNFSSPSRLNEVKAGDLGEEAIVGEIRDHKIRQSK